MTDLLALTHELVSIPSPSRDESAIAEHIASMLSGAGHLSISRVGDNVIARTTLGRPTRVVVAGHLDTVSTGLPSPRLVGDVLYGLGAADMKGTVAIMASLANELTSPSVDVTWIFYAREEIARAESGLLEIERADPTLLKGDVAILGEPTDGAVEAGCQGTLRLSVRIGGVTAHPARPYTGVNAIHRSVELLTLLGAARPREVLIDGVLYAEQLQVVGINGGSGGNVVPDETTVVINHRFAPDRSLDEAASWLRSVIEPALDPAMGDEVAITDGADGALPHLEHPVLERLVSLSGRPPAAKVGWTDVATFAARGVPAANFGAGDPLVAHHPEECVHRSSLRTVDHVLRSLLS